VGAGWAGASVLAKIEASAQEFVKAPHVLNGGLDMGS